MGKQSKKIWKGGKQLPQRPSYPGKNIRKIHPQNKKDSPKTNRVVTSETPCSFNFATTFKMELGHFQTFVYCGDYKRPFHAYRRHHFPRPIK